MGLLSRVSAAAERPRRGGALFVGEDIAEGRELWTVESGETNEGQSPSVGAAWTRCLTTRLLLPPLDEGDAGAA
jgi:hypothetical protein